MIWLIRHGETAWSLSRQHTGSTDIPLTEAGLDKASLLKQRLAKIPFSLVLSSPLQRARQTCEGAGFGARAIVDANLREWDYGEFEGRTTAEIRQSIPGWDVWTNPITGGESVAEVGSRADRVLARVASSTGDVALFGHAHILRILAARWLGLPADSGRFFALETASVSALGKERKTNVIHLWNDVHHLRVWS